jgi:hypothetical protein
MVWHLSKSCHHLKQQVEQLPLLTAFIFTPLPQTALLPRWLGRLRLSIWSSLAVVAVAVRVPQAEAAAVLAVI